MRSLLGNGLASGSALCSLVASLLLTVCCHGQDFTYEVADTEVDYDVDTVEGTFTIPVSIIEDSENDGFPTNTQGFSFALEADPDFVLPVSGEITGELVDLNDGEGPDFVAIGAGEDDRGFTVGIVYSLMSSEFVTLDGEVIDLTFELVPDSLIDATENTEVDLFFSDDLIPAGAGDPPPPPVANTVVIEGGVSIEAILDDGLLTLVPVEALFRRGDADNDGSVFVLVDALFVLEWAFASGPVPPCMDTADADGDGEVFALIDAIFLLNWAFKSGTAPPDPGPTNCGGDPDGDEDGIGCDTPPDNC